MVTNQSWDELEVYCRAIADIQIQGRLGKLFGTIFEKFKLLEEREGGTADPELSKRIGELEEKFAGLFGELQKFKASPEQPQKQTSASSFNPADFE